MISHAFRAWSIAPVFTIHAALARIEKLKAIRLAIVDLNLPDSRWDPGDPERTGLRLVKRLQGRFETKVVVFSAHCSELLVSAASRLGAEFMVKDYSELDQLVRRLSLASMAGGWGRGDRVWKAERTLRLTKREAEVLALRLSGRSGDEIGSELAVSLSTIRTHFKNIRNKAGARSMRAFMASLVDGL